MDDERKVEINLTESDMDKAGEIVENQTVEEERKVEITFTESDQGEEQVTDNHD